MCKGLDACILKHLQQIRRPIDSTKLRELVIADFGNVHTRSFERHLKALRESRRLTATPTLQNYAPRFLYARRR